MSHKWISEKRFANSTKPLESSESTYRSEFDRDLGRLLHCSSFRRLQGKTQVWGVSESDFFRTRLTHSLEAGQIGKSLAAAYGISQALVMTSCLAHDIGHPPFGHDGAEVLNKFAKEVSNDKLCFDDNAQNLRIVSFLESAYGLESGLNLTASTLDGMLKYKREAKSTEEKAGYYKEDQKTFEWILETTGTGLKRNPIVMFVELADDIAYACHDLEDAMRAGFVGISEIQQMARKEDTASPEYVLLNLVLKNLQDFSDNKLDDPEHYRVSQKKVKAFLVDRFIREAISLKNQILPKMINMEYDDNIKRNLFFDSSPTLEREIKILKNLVKDFVIKQPNVQNLRFSSTSLLRDFLERHRDLFTTKFKNDGAAFFGQPKWVQRRMLEAKDPDGRLRVFLDYVSGMTDTYLIQQASTFYNLNFGRAVTMRK